MAARTGPMHGAAHTAKAPPRRTREPRLRAPRTSPAPRSRSGHGRSPMNASPKMTRTKPATFSSRNWSAKRRPPTSAAPTPSSTKNAVKPSTNGKLARTTRRAVPGCPSRSASTADTADRYPGTSGRTHGARNETMPATNATGIAVQLISVVEAGELFVDEPLELRVERRRLTFRRRAAAAPRPDEQAEGYPAPQKRPEREEPREEAEAALGRGREHPCAELADERVLDLLLSVTRGNSHPDERLHPLRDRRVRLVQRRLADRAHELGFEVGRVRRAR